MDYDVYEGLKSDLVKQGLFPLLYEAARRSPEDMATYVRELLLSAVKEVGDSAAVAYVGLYLQALRDIELLPFVVEGKVCGGRPGIPHYSKEVDEARDRAAVRRAHESCELLRVVHDRGVSSLVETRKALLSEIAGRWSATKDEDESGRLFAFLCRFDTGSREKRQLVAEAFRKAGGSRDRLRKSAVVLARGDVCCDDILQTLVVGWARGVSKADVLRALGTLEVLSEASDAAFEYLAETAEGLAALERKISGLKARFAQLSLRQREREIAVRYVSLSEIAIDIPLAPETVATYSYGRRVGYDENQAHDEFSKRCLAVEEWHAVNPDIKVHLRMRTLSVQMRYADKPTDVFPFERTKTFG